MFYKINCVCVHYDLRYTMCRIIHIIIIKCIHNFQLSNETSSNFCQVINWKLKVKKKNTLRFSYIYVLYNTILSWHSFALKVYHVFFL